MVNVQNVVVYVKSWILNANLQFLATVIFVPNVYCSRDEFAVFGLNNNNKKINISTHLGMFVVKEELFNCNGN